MNLLYPFGRSPSGENSSFVFSAGPHSNGKFCSEAWNRKQEVNRTDFPNSSNANHCTCCGWELPWGVNLLSKRRSHANYAQKISYSRVKRNAPSAFFLNGGKQSGIDSGDNQGCPHQNQTATKNNEVSHFDAQTLFSELLLLRSLFCSYFSRGQLLKWLPSQLPHYVSWYQYFLRGPSLKLASWNSKPHPCTCPFSQFPSQTDSSISFTSDTNSASSPITARLWFATPGHFLSHLWSESLALQPSCLPSFTRLPDESFQQTVPSHYSLAPRSATAP